MTVIDELEAMARRYILGTSSHRRWYRCLICDRWFRSNIPAIFCLGKKCGEIAAYRGSMGAPQNTSPRPVAGR